MKKLMLTLSAMFLFASAPSAFACQPGCVCLPHHRHHHRQTADEYVWVPVAVVTVRPLRALTLPPPPVAYAPEPGYIGGGYGLYSGLERRGGYSW